MQRFSIHCQCLDICHENAASQIECEENDLAVKGYLEKYRNQIKDLNKAEGELHKEAKVLVNQLAEVRSELSDRLTYAIILAAAALVSSIL